MFRMLIVSIVAVAFLSGCGKEGKQVDPKLGGGVAEDPKLKPVGRSGPAGAGANKGAPKTSGAINTP